MGNNTPKDVVMTQLETCDITNDKTGICFFKGFEIDLRQEVNNPNPLRPTTPDIFLDINGHIIAAYNSNDVQELVNFYIQIKRTDIIEILKFGQYVTMKGSGYISNMANDTSGDFWKIVIRVSGEIKIK